MAKSKKSAENTKPVDNDNSSHVIAKKHITFFARHSQDHTSHCRCRCFRSQRVITQPISVKTFDDKLKRVVIVTENKLVDNKAFLSQFKVSDFSLATLIDTGALASMSSVSLKGDNLTSIANIDRTMDLLDSFDNSNINS